MTYLNDATHVNDETHVNDVFLNERVTARFTGTAHLDLFFCRMDLYGKSCPSAVTLSSRQRMHHGYVAFICVP